MTIVECNRMWSERVELQKNSGQTMIKWCQSNNVNVRQFYRWRRRLIKSEINNSSRSNPFILAKPTQERYETNLIENESSITIRIGKVNIMLQRGFDEDDLSCVVRVVAKVC